MLMGGSAAGLVVDDDDEQQPEPPGFKQMHESKFYFVATTPV